MNIPKINFIFKMTTKFKSQHVSADTDNCQDSGRTQWFCMTTVVLFAGRRHHFDVDNNRADNMFDYVTGNYMDSAEKLYSYLMYRVNITVCYFSTF